MKLKSVKIIIVSLFAFLFAKMQAQTSDTNFRTPVAETIHKLEIIFNVKIEDNKGLLKDKMLDYADWKIEPDNLEVSLANVLAPFNLTTFEAADGTYEIREFQYHRVSVPKSKDRLAFLSSLYNDKETWETRKAELKNCMITAFGIDKAPKTPNFKPILTSKRKYKNYTVENIGLEILPGFYTTGSIYKPYPLKEKAAIILTPNGHFSDGRYREDEQFRCAMLAKMGAIVVSYDLFSWGGESLLQFPVQMHRSSIASTVQVLSGMRLLDYVATIKHADVSRVGVTGGSGGGSHTMFLAALDDRVTVSVPTVMVSANHSGGCPCESGRGIHLCGNGTNNVEVAAMAAPKPQLIISDGKDWTSEVPKLEFPFVQRIYDFYGEKELVENAHFAEEGHDYGLSKRMAMYPFMAKYLDLDLRKVKNKKGEIDESTCTIELKEKLLVFGDNGEKLPANALKDIDKLYELFGEKNHRKYEVKE
ncbi:acetylxylan esterase [Mariniflexile litorale]|uniref:Acetylxylan esterase n=1 Tax=Mariniflexile litorale TaxID=3045158 RepID=A0AAU7E8Z7_9FLAO|nr:acetylxylan esterase [Mariniflexile sp. KMM 9835]MDQ8210542.1 acetylxylan esterase [Mariniflexile sp. KMM 9835]